MRLPDGLLNANGAPQKLRDEDVPIMTVDGTTAYSSWADFCTTLRHILDREKAEHGAGKARG